MKPIPRFLLSSWIVLSLLVYGSVLVSPKWVAYSALVSVGVPIIVLANLLFLGIALFRKKKPALYFLVLLLIAIPFINVGISFSGVDDVDKQGLKVLNYNVKWFTDARKNNYAEAIDWVKNLDADIMCFQEFYPHKKIAQRIRQGGKYNEALFNDRYNLAIYSKYPIINKGLLLEIGRAHV